MIDNFFVSYTRAIRGYGNIFIQPSIKKFFDKKILLKFDNNPYLLGFNNGVYDFTKKCFRNNNPEDYVTMSVGYDYKEFTISDEIIKDIESFFLIIQPQKDIRDQLMLKLASLLVGIKTNDFSFWTGIESCYLADLLEHTFGSDYFCAVPYFNLGRYNNEMNNLRFYDEIPCLVTISRKRVLCSNWIDCEEISDYKLDINKIKRIVNDDELGVGKHILSYDNYNIKAHHKLIIISNNKKLIEPKRLLQCAKVFSFPNEFCIDKSTMEKWKQAFMWLLINVYYPIYENNKL